MIHIICTEQLVYWPALNRVYCRDCGELLGTLAQASVICQHWADLHSEIKLITTEWIRQMHEVPT